MRAREGVGDLGRPSYQLPAFGEFTADLGLLTLLHGLGKDSVVWALPVSGLRGDLAALDGHVPRPAVTGTLILLANLGLNQRAIKAFYSPVILRLPLFKCLLPGPGLALAEYFQAGLSLAWWEGLTLYNSLCVQTMSSEPFLYLFTNPEQNKPHVVLRSEQLISPFAFELSLPVIPFYTHVCLCTYRSTSSIYAYMKC